MSAEQFKSKPDPISCLKGAIDTEKEFLGTAWEEVRMGLTLYCESKAAQQAKKLHK